MSITIREIKYFYQNKLDSIDLDLVISYVIKKEREFVMAHPEYVVTSNQQSVISKMIARRLKNEPLAYILGEKEFYGLNFKVTPQTLIPRPETELIVEMAMEFMKAPSARVIPEVSISERAQRFHGNTTFWDDTTVIDIGTGSGNIIISLAKTLDNFKFEILNLKFFGTDISKEALKIAKQNAQLHNVNKKIKFLHGDLLNPFLKKILVTDYELPVTRLLILANLPYLSRDIYNSCADNVKKYEPKTALYSSNHGLAHYDKLLKQIKLLVTNYKPCPEAKLFGMLCPDAKLFGVTALLEISPEQKKLLSPLVKKYFPEAKIEFKKDLAQKWRVCKVEI